MKHFISQPRNFRNQLDNKLKTVWDNIWLTEGNTIVLSTGFQKLDYSKCLFRLASLIGQIIISNLILLLFK